MKRLLTVLLSAAGFAAAEYNVGDRVPVVLDHFAIIFSRDEVKDTATVLYKGADCYVAACYMNTYLDLAPDSAEQANGDTMDTLLVDTTFADSVAQAVFNDFQTGGGKGKLLGVWGVSSTDLVDVDGDPRVFILLAPVYMMGTDAGGVDLGIRPIMGYFDPFNEDTTDTTGLSNRMEMIVLNVENTAASMINPGAGWEGLTAYFYSRYVVWCLDQEEDLVSITGLAMYNAFKAGYPVLNGLTNVGQKNRQYGGERLPTNYTSLYGYTFLYTNSVVAREQDRERMLLWLLWLSENLNDGENFIKELAFNDDYLARYEIAERIDADLGISERDAFVEFALDCILHHYGMPGYGFSSVSATDTLFPQTTSPGQTYVKGMSTDLAVALNNPNPLPVLFKGQEKNKIPVGGGDSIPGFKVYVLDVNTSNYSASTLTDYTDQQDSLNLIRFPDMAKPDQIIVVNRNSSAYWYRIKVGDTTGPKIIGLYSIQNPAFLKMAEIYLAAGEKPICSDVGAGDTLPKLAVVPADSAFHPAIYTMATVLDANDKPFEGDTVKRLFKSDVALELKDDFGNVFSGDVYIRLHRVFDNIGNYPATILEDTLGLVHIYGAGTYSLIGGNLVLEIPQGALADGTLVLVDRADAELVLADGSEGTAFQIGAKSIPVMKPFTVRLTTDGPSGLYYKNGDSWEPIQAYMSPDNAYLVAHLDKMGTYLLGRPGAPKVTVPELWAPTAIREGEARVYLSLPMTSKVSWNVYDVSGKRVAQPYEGTLDQGSYVLTWNTSDTPSGIYFYRIAVNEETHLRKVAFIGR